MKPRPVIRCLLAALLAGAVVGWPARSAAADAPAPAKARTVQYYLNSNDRIHVDVAGESELSASQRIDASGNVNLAYIGDVHLAGLTRDQAGKVIQDAYIQGRFLKQPQVIVTIEEYTPRMVAIQGAVKNAGRFELPTESTLSVVELVTKAGGFTDIGKGSDVRITRANGKTVQHVDVEGIIKGTSKTKPDDDSLLLQPGDIVFVPEKLI
jgi:polysaccharide export outer membrane protein